ncbi:hypothetical protein [Actinomadura coerulea]|uniref:hypothetical protein n=1 Tax=Actinomadura coerulea TaxID=46159 RepID=UPI0034293649
MDSLRAAGWKFPERPDAGDGQRDDREDQSDESSSAAPAGEKPKTLADPSAEAGAKTKEKPETGDTEGSSQPPEEHGRDKTSPAQSGNSGAEAEKSVQAKPEDPRQVEGEREDDDRGSAAGQPQTDETGGQDDRDQDPPPQDNADASSTGDRIDGDNSEDFAPPSPQSSEQRPGPRVETTDDPAPIQSTPPADSSPLPAQPHSRLQSLALARAEQLAAAERNRAIFQGTQTTNDGGQNATGQQGDASFPPYSATAAQDSSGQPPKLPEATASIGDTGDGDPPDDRYQPPSPSAAEAAEPRMPKDRLPSEQQDQPLASQDSAKPGDISQAISPQNDTDQRDEGDEKTGSSPGEQQGVQEEAEVANGNGETATEPGGRDASRSEPEGGKWIDEKPPAEALEKVPDKWGDGSPNKKGVGRRWTDPENRGNGIRIDEGDPNNPQPAQQVDHVVVRVNGKVIGRNGQPLEGSIKENWDQAHVPLSEWLKWDSWKSP